MDEKEDDGETTCRLPMDDMPDFSDGDDVESCGLPMDDMPEDSSEELDEHDEGNAEDRLDWTSLRAQLESKLRNIGQDGVKVEDRGSGDCNGWAEKAAATEEGPAGYHQDATGAALGWAAADAAHNSDQPNCSSGGQQHLQQRPCC